MYDRNLFTYYGGKNEPVAKKAENSNFILGTAGQFTLAFLLSEYQKWLQSLTFHRIKAT